jgi:hypothetical protein
MFNFNSENGRSAKQSSGLAWMSKIFVFKVIGYFKWEADSGESINATT